MLRRFIVAVLILCLGQSFAQTRTDAYQNITIFPEAPAFIEPLWSTTLLESVCSNCVNFGKNTFFYLENNKLKVHSVNSGEVLWQFELSPDAIISSGQGLIVIFDSGNILALAEETGELEWQKALESVESSNISLPILYSNDILFFQNGITLLALEVLTGKQVWETETHWIFHKLLLLTETLILFDVTEKLTEPASRAANIGGGLVALERTSGIEKWKITKDDSAFQSPPSLLYGDDKNLLLINTVASQNYAAEIKQYSSLTGELIADCELEPSIDTLQRYGPGAWWQVLKPENFSSDGQWIYFVTREAYGDIPRDIYRFPLCNETLQVASQDTSDENWKRTFIPEIIYASTEPFDWIAGPYKDSLILFDGFRLVKTTEPIKTYMSQSLQYDYIVIGPTLEYRLPFRDNYTNAMIDPNPFEIFSGVVGPISRLEIIDDKVIVGMASGLIQVSDFSTTKTVFRRDTHYSTFISLHFFNRILVVEAKERGAITVFAIDTED
ncbi:MAG: PQQ-binding-like beta-propeller repeat protein [Trueperaceae bacterium]|nr:PQQ-binding-like beta-propeller repeat protein [Trueperaceae bacterium]